MAHHQHGHKTGEHKERRIGEQGAIAHVPHQKARENGRHDLRRHAHGVIVTRVFAHVRTVGHLHHHGVAVYVDEGPAEARENEENVQKRRHLVEERARRKGHAQKQHAHQNGLFAADARRDGAHRQIGHNGRRRADHQNQRETAFQFLGGVPAETGGNGVVAHEPQKHAGQNKGKAARLGRGHFFARAVRCGFFFVR